MLNVTERLPDNYQAEHHVLLEKVEGLLSALGIIRQSRQIGASKGGHVSHPCVDISHGCDPGVDSLVLHRLGALKVPPLVVGLWVVAI